MKKMIVFSVLALAFFMLPAIAQDEGGKDAKSFGAFAWDDKGMDEGKAKMPFMSKSCGGPDDASASDCCLPAWCNPIKMNFDTVEQGNQLAFGSSFPFSRGFATNNFNLDKTQLSSCGLYNIEQIKSGNQMAIAIGGATATNNVNIKTCQQ